MQLCPTFLFQFVPVAQSETVWDSSCMNKDEVAKVLADLRKRYGMTDQRLAAQVRFRKFLGDVTVDEARKIILDRIDHLPDTDDAASLRAGLISVNGHSSLKQRETAYGKQVSYERSTIYKYGLRGLSALVDVLWDEFGEDQEVNLNGASPSAGGEEEQPSQPSLEDRVTELEKHVGDLEYYTFNMMMTINQLTGANLDAARVIHFLARIVSDVRNVESLSDEHLALIEEVSRYDAMESVNQLKEDSWLSFIIERLRVMQDLQKETITKSEYMMVDASFSERFAATIRPFPSDDQVQ